MRLFADDTIAYITVTSDDNILQEDLDKLALWEEKWMMKFHPDKCQVLLVTKNRPPIIKDYVLHSHTLEHVTSEKYLVVTITSDLKWENHIRNICAKEINNRIRQKKPQYHQQQYQRKGQHPKVTE